MNTLHTNTADPTTVAWDTPRARDSLALDKDHYAEQVKHLLPPILQRLDRISKAYMLFNMLFAVLGTIQLLFVILFFTHLTHSSTLAFSLALLFLTGFSYFILRLYLNARKPEQLLELRDSYFDGCKKIINYQEGIAEHHLALANAACKFAAALHDREYTYYTPPQWADYITPKLETFSCWAHWHDIHQMKEYLLQTSVDEHIKLVKCEPTSLEAHATLANAYVILSSLYADPRKTESYDEERYIPPEKFAPQFHDRFRSTAERAIEEFKILNDYAPNDPWVHAQLAYSYHDLQMPEEEIHQYETLLQLNPNDKETLFKLGMLYFQQGHNSKGLQIYQELKRSYYQKAESLIKFYGAYSPPQELL